ncbi:LysR family transcriptional regulator [Dorea sp. D27]|uniref:LysR family transcriptional regulator n=1 Tax=Dorea sp. D27 TaxID=658665 RepID=UPI0006739927|nr:LysR family transcriptional regulator [Dorea sp. D27]KMZ54426.1 putative transcriptional regulator, LysR family [Dorea sp. D27]
MDIQDLNCFVTVCKYKNFTRAGKELHFSQQAVSKIIKHLEASLGVPLFIRGHSKLRLTEYGTYLYPMAKNLCDEFQVLNNNMSAFIARDNGKLRIAIPRGMTWELIGEQLQSFYNHHTDAQLLITQTDDLGVENALLDGSADIGFCIAPISLESFVIHKTCRADTYYMISTLNPLSEKDTLSIRDMRKEKFIGFGAQNKGHDTLKHYCEAEGFEPVLYAEVEDMNILYQMVRENRGIGFYVGYPEKASPIDGIKLVRDTSAGWYWEIILATGRHHELRPVDKAFIKEFHDWM